MKDYKLLYAMSIITYMPVFILAYWYSGENAWAAFWIALVYSIGISMSWLWIGVQTGKHAGGVQ